MKLWKGKSGVDINTFAPCGIICGLCKDIDTKCKGCRSGGCDNNCFHFNCCKAKGIAGCWECEGFPCGNGYFIGEQWRGIITGFAKCIKVAGRNNFYKKVKAKLGSSIDYQKYKFISEQNIINMFYD